MKESLEILRAVDEGTQRYALATLVRVEGSAYRKPGASMLIGEDGQRIGLLSAGCLEEDLAGRAEELFADPNAFEAGCARLLAYDMRAEDDLGWGTSTGCNGVVQVLLEPVHAQLRKELRLVLRYVERGRYVEAVRRLSREGAVGEYRFMAKGGSRFGRGYVEDVGEEETDKSFQFCKRWEPRPRLFVIGAGPDARPLVSMAASVGFSVSVVDRRPAFCAKLHFPDADRCIVGRGEEAFRDCGIRANDFVVVMSHHFETDREWLRRLLKEEVRYLGLLGSRNRAALLLAGEDLPARLHTPVGLPIGAEGPEEIAVSVLAELIRVFRSDTRLEV